jgi:hypothetical protein
MMQLVIGCPFVSSWIFEKRSSFSYLGQNQKNYKQGLGLSEQILVFIGIVDVFAKSLWVL